MDMSSTGNSALVSLMLIGVVDLVRQEKTVGYGSENIVC